MAQPLDPDDRRFAYREASADVRHAITGLYTNLAIWITLNTLWFAGLGFIRGLETHSQFQRWAVFVVGALAFFTNVIVNSNVAALTRRHNRRTYDRDLLLPSTQLDAATRGPSAGAVVPAPTIEAGREPKPDWYEAIFSPGLGKNFGRVAGTVLVVWWFVVAFLGLVESLNLDLVRLGLLPEATVTPTATPIPIVIP